MKKNEIEKIFKKLDLKVRSTGHNYGWLIVSGKKILRVHYSHGKGDIPEKVVNKIRGQLKLPKKDFKELADCPLTYKDYINVLKQKGIID
ncbi:hypothetical protein LM599_00100 [Candidatus Acetothermia bacterium]|jgi:hypothetical protein|nr:hypothetical protein [Candidatus Acetothermia bacterium]